MTDSDTESFHSAVDSLLDEEHTNTSDNNFKRKEIVGERRVDAVEDSEYQFDGSNQSEMLFMNRKKQIFEDRSFSQESAKCKSVLEGRDCDVVSADEAHFDQGRKVIAILSSLDQELKVGDVPSRKTVEVGFQTPQWSTSQLSRPENDNECDEISGKNAKLFATNVFKSEGVRKFGSDSNRKSETESESSGWGLTSRIVDEKCNTNMAQKMIDHEGWDDWGELEDVEKHGDNSAIQNESQELPCTLTCDKQNVIMATDLKAELGTKEIKTNKSFWNWSEFGDMVAAVEEGLTNISSVVESGLGLPTAEELVRNQSIERPANDSGKAIRETKEITSSNIKSYGMLFAGLGANAVTSSLDVLEALGKKTFEKLTVPQQGSEKRRFIFEPERGQNLSEVLRELRESRAEEATLEISCLTKRELAFIDFFEKFSGILHLEGLEMLSKNYLQKIPPQRRREVNEIFAEDLANTLEEYQDDEQENFVHNFKEILLAIALPYKGSGLVDSYTRCQGRLEKLSDCSDRNFELFLECLADFTAESVQSIHKLGQLLLITAAPVKQEPFSEFHNLIGRQISCFSNQFAQHISAVGTPSKEIEELVMEIFLAAGDSFSYVQQSFRLLRPLLLL
ncbi:unnamed protein product [Litomosoides sigmodontis]|uniref:Uncharacterized protein n=1 Tax=Litomosoides sigmodontis TaxID=42156 RepID=A0A3P6TUT3_LITSI|nr:unnamed protein product [Litomosoides sigmodontis]